MKKREIKTNTVISKDTISRLLRDVKTIMKNPLTDNDIYYFHDEEDILKGYAMIVGPEDTPYFGGFYFFELLYPTDYPHSPPQVIYYTNGDNVRFNPNLYTNGKVCVSLLNTWSGEQWTSCQTISTVLLTLCTLLCKDPLLNEPGVQRTNPDFNKYTRIIECKNIEIAVLRMMEKRPNESFEVFYPFMRESFVKNADKIEAFLKDKGKSGVEPPEVIKTVFYSINTMVDYTATYAAFMKFRKIIE
jgi:ubiquitin-conjugating enzyme E2 Z